MTFVIATGYLLIGALQVDPFVSDYRVTVQLPESAGLLPNQDVTLRGVPVGKVERLDITPAGVDAVIAVKSGAPIPMSSDVRVSGLSPAGEQYIDFVASSNDGPFLGDGSIVEQGRATVPVSLADLLAHADGALAQVDTAKLDIIRRELSLSEEGPQKLADIIDGGTFLLSTLDSVLPETTSLLRTSQVGVHPGRRQERRNRRGGRQSGGHPGRCQPDAGGLSSAHRSGAGRAHRYRQSVRRQLRHHGATARQPHHHIEAAVPAGAGAQRVVPGLPHLGTGRAGQRHARQRVVGHR